MAGKVHRLEKGFRGYKSLKIRAKILELWGFYELKRFWEFICSENREDEAENREEKRMENREEEAENSPESRRRLRCWSRHQRDPLLYQHRQREGHI